LGLRWQSDGRWELGGLVRVQTLGFDESDSAALAGLGDRGWTLEVAPTIGWHGDTHVDWTTFVDLLRNHKGANSTLRISWPVTYRNQFVIPEVGFHRYSKQFVDYYYGVPLTGARRDRPAYEGDAANGMSLGIGWGVRVTPKWLVTGKLGIEYFSSAIYGSPIVDDKDRRTMSLQVNYDSVPFRVPSRPPPGGSGFPPLELRLGVAHIDKHAGDTAGDYASGRDSLMSFDASLRFRQRHRVGIGGLSTSYGPLMIKNLQLVYGFDLVADQQKTLTLQAGLQTGEISLEADDAMWHVPARSTALLPTFGVDSVAHFRNRFSIGARLQWFRLEADRYTGRQVFASFGVFHRTFDKASLGIGYVFNRISLTSGKDELGASIEPLYQGPSLLVSMSF
jgi:hypothetical protein